MSTKSASDHEGVSYLSVREPSLSLKAIAVGDSDEWQEEGNLAPRDGLAFVAFHDVDEETLTTLQPSVIFSPLLAKTFDCIELALLLSKLGYTGRYHAYSRSVPKPEVIEREVRQLCPRLSFKIVDHI